MSKEKKDLNGVILVDKPEGISSAGLVAKVKWALGAKKAGHAGTLDPFATGLMVVCLGKATKLSKFFLDDDKTYIAEMVFGRETDTQDVTGIVINSQESFDISRDQFEKIIENFKGCQTQIPPSYSALKHKGVPLYKLARKGEFVVKPPRDINIYSIDILSFDSKSAVLEISCSKGTYIRTLCNDIGKKLGCFAYLKNLRRTFSSGFSLSDSVTLDKVNEDCIIDMRECLREFDELNVDSPMAKKILNGVRIEISDLDYKATKPLKIVFENRLIAVIEKDRENRFYNYCSVFHYI